MHESENSTVQGQSWRAKWDTLRRDQGCPISNKERQFICFGIGH